MVLNVAISIAAHSILAFMATVGALQIAILRSGLDGLAWPFGRRHRRLGHVSGSLMVVGAFVAAAFLRLWVSPLPPWLSLLTILAAAGVAPGVMIAGAAVRLRWHHRRREASQYLGKPVDLGPMWAYLYKPEDKDKDEPIPGLCLLPDPTAPEDDLSVLVRTLVQDGIAVLLFDWRSLASGTLDRLTLQGLVAVGISHLTRWPEVDAGRVGLIGVGLGGDLALRSAAMDASVTAVLAIEPVLSPHRPGLGIESLSTLSWFEARRRVRRWRRSPLLQELDALAAIPCIAPRPAAIITGCPNQSRLVDNLEVLRAKVICSLVPAAWTTTAMRATDWCRERLA